MPGSIEQREQAVRELRQKNQKDIFALPPELMAAGKPILIFNVGPFRHQRSMGSYGQWTIHPCSEGERYSQPTEVPYITNDPVHLDMFQMAHRHDSGKKLALDILGVGQFHTKGEDLTMWGVFVAEGDEPTDEELAKADKRLNRTWDALIDEADSYYAQGPQAYVNITDMHRKAARARNQMGKPWARGVVEMKNCPICASQVMPKAAICPNCKTVLDKEAVIKHKVPGYERLWSRKAREEAEKVEEKETSEESK